MERNHLVILLAVGYLSLIGNCRPHGKTHKDSSEGKTRESDQIAEEQRVALQIVTTESEAPDGGAEHQTNNRRMQVSASEVTLRPDNVNYGISFDDQYANMSSQLKQSHRSQLINQQTSLGMDREARQNITENRDLQPIQLSSRRIVINLDALDGGIPRSQSTRVTIGFPEEDGKKNVDQDLRQMPRSEGKGANLRSRASTQSNYLMGAIKRQGGIPTYVVENIEPGDSSPERMARLMLKSDTTEQMERKSRQRRNQQLASSMATTQSASFRLSDDLGDENANQNQLAERKDLAKDRAGLDGDSRRRRRRGRNETQESSTTTSTTTTTTTKAPRLTTKTNGNERDLSSVTKSLGNSLGAGKKSVWPQRIQIQNAKSVSEFVNGQVGLSRNPLEDTQISVNRLQGSQFPTSMLLGQVESPLSRPTPSIVGFDQFDEEPVSAIDGRNETSRDNSNQLVGSSEQMDERVAQLLERLKLYTTREHLLKVARDLERDPAGQSIGSEPARQARLRDFDSLSGQFEGSDGRAISLAEARNRVPLPIMSSNTIVESASSSQPFEEPSETNDQSRVSWYDGDDSEQNESDDNTRESKMIEGRRKDLDSLGTSELDSGDTQPLDEEDEESQDTQASEDGYSMHPNEIDQSRDHEMSALEDIIDELVRRENEADLNGQVPPSGAPF